MTWLWAMLALVVSAGAGYPIVRGALALARIVPPPGNELEEGRPEVLRGGSLIGVLERVSTTGLILAGQPALIAVIVAIKGLGRWSQLQDNPALQERFIIGSLASYLWAGACGFVTMALI